MKEQMSFPQYCSIYSNRIKENLKNFLTHEIKDSLISSNDLLDYLRIPYEDAFYGGKYLRGIFVCLGYELFAPGYDERIMFPSIAYEIFQTSILLKDDIIDCSSLRRGKPTLYKLLEGMGNTPKKSEAMTICLGDYGFGLVYKLVLLSSFEIEKKERAVMNLIDSINTTIIGQMLDIELSSVYDANNQKDISVILDVARYKTAYYTIIGPLTLGAILAGADEENIAVLKEFGEYLGIAFQIHDDILGIFGENIGKPTDSDIREKKITILYDYALRKCSKEDKEVLYKWYGDINITKEQVETIKSIFITSKALDYACKMKNEYRQKALESLLRLNIENEMKQVLEDAVYYITEREK